MHQGEDQKTFRIFISYRGNSPGEPFARHLFDYLNGDIDHRAKYGDVYFSQGVEAMGNFIEDIPRIMEGVEWFVLPLTDGFFDGFRDPENGRPDRTSVTHLEIAEAMRHPQVRFIAVMFPGFEGFEKNGRLQRLLENLYGDGSTRITGCKPFPCNPDAEDAAVRRLGDALIRPDYAPEGMASFMRGIVPNVFMTNKGETERADLYPFYQRIYDVKRIYLLNYAATSFFTGVDVASIYESTDQPRRWFQTRLMRGEVEVNAVLTHPYSAAAEEAARYKMYPVGGTMVKERIILHNLNKLAAFMGRHPRARLHAYLTDIGLPYGIMLTEHEHPENNHMKVDLYAPVTGDDRERPSFNLMESNGATATLYQFFKQNLLKILHDHSWRFAGHPPIDWLHDPQRPFIHKALARKGVSAHTRGAFLACLKRKLPMEVDLLMLDDGTLVVGRTDEFKLREECLPASWAEIRKINRKNREHNGNDSGDCLKFDEFLSLVDGQVPILVELKSDFHEEGNLENKRLARACVDALVRYRRGFRIPGATDSSAGAPSYTYAVHSSNPFVLKEIRLLDCLIPIGQISLDFAAQGIEVDPAFMELHQNMGFFDVVEPDFVSFDIRSLVQSKISATCRERGLPLVGWTVRNSDDEVLALDYCDTYIIEGADTFGAEDRMP